MVASAIWRKAKAAAPDTAALRQQMTLSFAKLQRTLAKRVPPGFANRMTARRPTRWREVLPVAGYAAGGIVVATNRCQYGKCN